MNYFRKYCSDPQGKLLEDFQIAKTDALASIMNCSKLTEEFALKPFIVNFRVCTG